MGVILISYFLHFSDFSAVAVVFVIQSHDLAQNERGGLKFK